jgi:hypothetical protein
MQLYVCDIYTVFVHSNARAYLSSLNQIYETIAQIYTITY